MEWGEQAHDTALRELSEETGLSADIGPLLGTQAEWFDETTSDYGERGLALRLIYSAANPTGTLKTDFNGDDTTIAAAWVPISSVSQLNKVEVVDFGLSLISKD